MNPSGRNNTADWNWVTSSVEPLGEPLSTLTDVKSTPTSR